MVCAAAGRVGRGNNSRQTGFAFVAEWSLADANEIAICSFTLDKLRGRC